MKNEKSKVTASCCPTCNSIENNDECDNSCGTKYCDNDHEYYVINGKAVVGHDPSCGSYSDIDLSSESDY